MGFGVARPTVDCGSGRGTSPPDAVPTGDWRRRRSWLGRCGRWTSTCWRCRRSTGTNRAAVAGTSSGWSRRRLTPPDHGSCPRSRGCPVPDAPGRRSATTTCRRDRPTASGSRRGCRCWPGGCGGSRPRGRCCRWPCPHRPAARAVLPMAVPAPAGRARLLLVPDEPRAAVAAVVDAPGGPVTVVSAHLSFAPTVSVRQVRALRRWVRSLPAPVVVAGDLNLPGTIPSRLTGWTPLAGGHTYPAARPRVQLDHLLLAHRDGPPSTHAATNGRAQPDLLVRPDRRVRAHDGARARAELSDHLPLVARLDTSG